LECEANETSSGSYLMAGFAISGFEHSDSAVVSGISALSSARLGKADLRARFMGEDLYLQM